MCVLWREIFFVATSAIANWQISPGQWSLANEPGSAHELPSTGLWVSRGELGRKASKGFEQGLGGQPRRVLVGVWRQGAPRGGQGGPSCKIRKNSPPLLPGAGVCRLPAGFYFSSPGLGPIQSGAQA